MKEASSSEDHFRSDLQVPRIAYVSVPKSKFRAGNIRRDCAAAEIPGVTEDVPVECIERFGADLKPNSLRNPSVLHDAEVFVVITETSEACDAGTAAEI